MDAKQQFRRRMEWLEAVACDARLNGGEKGVAILIAVKYLNSRSEKAYPSYATLAKEMGLARFSVMRAVKGMCEAGWLMVKRKGGGRKSNEYVLTRPENGKVIPFQLRSGN
jgi:hypothetical protein